MAFVKTRNPASSDPTPSGIKQGTMGGIATAAGARPGSRPMLLGQEVYLWALLIIEVAVMGYFRRHFRRNHGG